MCHSIREVRRSADPSTIVIYRLLGTTRHSSSAASVLKSVIHQLDKVLDRVTSADMLSSWKTLKGYFVSSAFSDGISRNVVLFLDSLDQLDVADGALDDLAVWIPGLKTDLPPNVRVVLSTLPNDRNKQLLRQAKLYMGDDSFVEVKLIYLPDEGVSRTAFGTMMELRASREVIVPNRRYSIVTSCSGDCSPFLFCCVVLGNCLIPIATCC